VDCFASIEQLARDLQAGRITSLALTESLLARIAALDPALHAFVAVFADRARDQARHADRSRTGSAGPLHGIPVALKDLIDVEGHVTGAGSRSLPETVAARSAHVARKLEDAGMIVLGKTHTVEFAFGGWGTNPVLGTPRNPFDMQVHRAPGGSSSGSAVAVAAGLVPAALGTDTGGSVRTPSAFCGLVGLKTSRGLIGRSGVFPLALSFDTIGPMVRAVRDAGLMLAAMAGPDPDDDATAGLRDMAPLAEVEDGVRGLRLAVLPDHELESVAPDVRALFQAAMAELERLGAQIGTIRLPHPVAHYIAPPGAIMSVEAYARLGAVVEDETNSVSAPARRRVGAGRGVSTMQYLQAFESRRADQAGFAAAMDGFHALACPTCFDIAAPLDAIDEDVVPTLCGRFVNYLDLASLALPIGLAPRMAVGMPVGMPVGMQVMVRRFADPLALRIGRALEASRGGLFTPPAL
jgi:aspartyl-tRNA(Asn)/glutamyl-tRNA(Gln) amidotransferase subunit A